MKSKNKNEWERQGRKGTYIEFSEETAPIRKIKSTSANAPKSISLISIWKHPDYDELQKTRVTKVKGLLKQKTKIARVIARLPK